MRIPRIKTSENWVWISNIDFSKETQNSIRFIFNDNQEIEIPKLQIFAHGTDWLRLSRQFAQTNHLLD